MIGLSGSALVVKPSWPATSDGSIRVALQAELSGSLSDRVMRVLEKDPRWAVLMGGPEGTKAYCGADVFGIEPATATTVEEITTAYAWAVCEWRTPVVPPATAADQPVAGLSTPIVVHLDPTRWELPLDGAAHDPSVRRMFPRDLWEPALRGGTSTVLAGHLLDERLLLIDG
jgi:hypothetical protein